MGEVVQFMRSCECCKHCTMQHSSLGFPAAPLCAHPDIHVPYLCVFARKGFCENGARWERKVEE